MQRLGPSRAKDRQVSSQPSDIQKYRIQTRAVPAYKEYVGKAEEYIGAVESYPMDYAGFYTIEDGRIVPKSDDGMAAITEKEQALLAASQKLQQTYKRYGLQSDAVMPATQQIISEKEKMLSGLQQEERMYYEEVIRENEEEFKKAVLSKPQPYGRSEVEYQNALNTWIETNQDILSANYNRSMQLIEGNLELSPEDEAKAAKVSKELQGFQWHKMGITDVAPQTWLQPAGGFWYQMPYMSGEYQEFNPFTFEITQKKADVEMVRYGFADFRPVLKSTQELGRRDILDEDKDYLVREKVLQNLFKVQPLDPNADIKKTVSAIARATAVKQTEMKWEQKQSLSAGFNVMTSKSKSSFSLLMPSVTIKKGKSYLV